MLGGGALNSKRAGKPAAEPADAAAEEAEEAEAAAAAEAPAEAAEGAAGVWQEFQRLSFPHHPHSLPRHLLHQLLPHKKRQLPRPQLLHAPSSPG